jgi:hypothetical protein
MATSVAAGQSPEASARVPDILTAMHPRNQTKSRLVCIASPQTSCEVSKHRRRGCSLPFGGSVSGSKAEARR